MRPIHPNKTMSTAKMAKAIEEQLSWNAYERGIAQQTGNDREFDRRQTAIETIRSIAFDLGFETCGLSTIIVNAHAHGETFARNEKYIQEQRDQGFHDGYNGVPPRNNFDPYMDGYTAGHNAFNRTKS